MSTIKAQLQKMQHNQLVTHYTDNALAPAEHYAHERFVSTRAFLTALPQNSRTYRRDKTQLHQNDFTPASLAQKAQNEINAIIALTHGIPSENSLTDLRVENQQLISVGADNFLTRMIQVNANNDPELVQAIGTIRTLSQPVYGMLILEFPSGIFTPDFMAQQHPNGILGSMNDDYVQNHMDALSSVIKQYARRLEFVNHLNTHLICKNAIEYHFGRMARFLMEIPNNHIEATIGTGNLAQWRVLRNFIQHDLEEHETYGITANEWLCHYLGIVTQDLPYIQPLMAVAPVATP